MIRVSQLKIPVSCDTPEYIQSKLVKLLNIEPGLFLSYKPVKRSIDARKKNNLYYVYNVDVCVRADEEKIIKRCADSNIRFAPKSEPLSIPSTSCSLSPIICGMGPAGLFCAYVLALSGANPILIERGKAIEDRLKDIENFINTRTLNPESNIQFGEGGAGTFSDGKLTTGTSGKELKFILETFVRFGAPENILYDSKPHIGTDVLRTVIQNMRNELRAFGTTIHFETKLTDMQTENGILKSITVSKDGHETNLPCQKLILAIGHSARDTFELLYNKKLNLEQKPFSMGVRIEHKQHNINMAQYGTDTIGSADYKLNVKTTDGRGVYTFCMCPGGHVVAAASETGGVVTNGMSFHARDGENANAALLCDVRPSDFDSTHPLAGMHLQKKYEKLAYKLGGGNYNAPATLVRDFLNGNASAKQGSITPTYKPAVAWCNIADCLPTFISEALREAIPMFGKKLNGFDAGDAVLTAIESRSSSPVRIIRDSSLQSNIQGVYPCGEGAGYAGGIMSAAADGIKVALQIIKQNNLQL